MRLGELRQRAAKLPPIHDLNQFMKTTLPKPKTLIDGILHQGSKMSVGGGSKSFKTWMLLDLALSVSSGTSWLGFPTTQAKVLYCNFEIQPEFIQDRVKALEEAKAVNVEAGCLDLWNLRGSAAAFDVIIPAILERIKEREYGLIVLDPIYKLYGETDENSAGNVAALMNALEELAVKSSAAVVFGAHFSKGNQAGKDSIDRVSGSGVFARDPDSLITVTRHEEEEAFVVEATLRNFKPVEPFVVRWEYPRMVRAEGLNPGKLKAAGSKKAIYTVKDLKALIAQETLTTKQLKEAAITSVGMSQSLFYQLLRELKQEPGIHYDLKQTTWQYENPTKTKLV